MSGLAWLNGRHWWEVSRDERYFCAELYHLIRQDITRFVLHLNSVYQADLELRANWEVVYEACFYRDMWHAGDRATPMVSPKRTFDLALFSDQDILLIEAKAQQEFESTQLRSFRRDIEQVQLITGAKRVRLAALASSQYELPDDVKSYFDGICMSWKSLAQLYSDNLQLLRADSIFKASENWSATNNTGGYRSGAELAIAYAAGERLWVGRSGGADGEEFAMDLATGVWRTRMYETNPEARTPPNRNWFSLDEFVSRLQPTKR